MRKLSSVINAKIEVLLPIQMAQVQPLDWSRKWQFTPVFLPGKFHEQRSLVGYSPWGRKESDAEAEAPKLWPPDAKSQLNGKDLDARKD